MIKILTWLSVLAFVTMFGTAAAEFSLDDLKKRTFNYFWEIADPNTGLIPDRAPSKTFSSTAAHGFGIAGYLVGVENGYVSRLDAAKRVLKSLKFLFQLPQNSEKQGIGGYKGFFYHFLHMHTGFRFLDVELSSIDTALLIAGVLACQSYFDNENDPVETELRQVADDLYRRIDWQWFVLPGTNLLSMGWHPESGFLDARWDGYNEGMIIYILALGSPTHTISADSWKEWVKPYVWDNFNGYEHVNFGPIFGHQYSHMFVDFRGIQDDYMKEKGIDYFINSQRATLANRAYCAENPFGFRGYSDKVWGLTACDGPSEVKKTLNGREINFMSYTARGAAINYNVDDGTIAPTAAGGSIPFAPDECIAALKEMYDKYGSLIYGEYGFKDAFNPSFVYEDVGEYGWVDQDHIGIDQGPILIQIANYQTGLIWNQLKKNKYIVAGLKRAGFTGGWLDGAKVHDN